jgi:ribosome recycling factor
MYNFTQAKQEFKKIEEWLTKEFSQLHTGRATPMLLDSVSVESYGSYMPIKNVGSVSIEDAKTLRIVPWDKSQIRDIDRAITAANLGLSIASDDQGLRVIFPALTTETRQKLVKVLKEKLEEGRISVRQEREKLGKAIEEAEKSGGMSEDDKFRSKEELQKIVEETNKNLEALFEKKENEVLNQ